MKAHLALLFLACLLAQGLCRKGRKIVFDTSTEPPKDVEYSDAELPAFGTDEYYDNLRWVAVTSEGYEYEGTLDEAKALFAGDSDDPLDRNPSIEDKEIEETFQDIAKEGDLVDDSGFLDENPTPEQEPIPEEGPEEPIPEEGPEKPDVNEQSVIKPDTRIKIRYPRYRIPWRYFGRVARGCSGTFIANKIVLTAGHCMYIRGKGWNRNLNFHRGKDCDPNQGQVFKYRTSVTFRGWTQSALPQYDIGIIVLYNSYPFFLPFGFEKVSASNALNIAGYPGDKSGWCLWYTYCRNAYYGSKYNLLRHKCDTAGGMSGSSMYIKRGNKRTVVAVHAYGFGGHASNGAAPLTPSLVTTLNSLIKRYNGN